VVLDAERTQAAADAALAQSDALVTTYQIALFRALAGGWQAED
jgi:outer membrane protein TolC